MALPSSGQIGLLAIYTELTGSGTPPGAGISLYNASTGTYAEINPNSEAQPNTTAPYEMSSWYSYDQSAVGSYEYNFNDGPYGSPAESCTFGPGSPPLSLWSADSTLVMGTVLYTDSGLSNGFDGGMQWWYCQDFNTSYQINRRGQIEDISMC